MRTVSSRASGRGCGLARALDIVGERWSLLIVGDLLDTPKRFTDIHLSLPGISTNILTSRLKVLERERVVRRRLLPPPDRSAVYELTERGRRLEGAILQLGRWGENTSTGLLKDEAVTVERLMESLHSAFNSKAARGIHARYELRLGEVVVHAIVSRSTLVTAAGPAQEAGLVMEFNLAIESILSGGITLFEAIENGGLRCTGDAALLAHFVEMFRF